MTNELLNKEQRQTGSTGCNWPRWRADVPRHDVCVQRHDWQMPRRPCCRGIDQIWLRQIIWYALGLGAAAAICLVDYHTLARWSFVAYWAMILCLVAVLIPHIGQTHGWGARRWIDLPFFQFQPQRICQAGVHSRGGQFLEPSAG